MSTQTIFEATRNAISSPALASGPTHFGAPDGQTTDLFGPVPVRVNLSARQAKALGLMTSGTCGRHSTTSLKSAALQLCLESRLRARTQTLGSTLYAMTWKPWVTPSGRSRFRLRASVLRTSGTGFTGWVTHTTRDWKDSGADIRPRADGSARLDQLPRQANLCGWPTTTASDVGRYPAKDFAPPPQHDAESFGVDGRMGDTHSIGARWDGRSVRRQVSEADGQHRTNDVVASGADGMLADNLRPGPTNGYWRDADWLLCRDGKWRPVEPGTFPLVDGAPARVGRLRAYGNAIVAEAAAEFIAAAIDLTR